MPLFFVTACKFPPASFARKRFFTSVGPDVGSQVVGPAEGPHTDAALKRLLTSVDTDMPCEFVTSRKPAIAAVNGTCVWAFMWRRFGGTVRIFAWFHRKEF